MSSPKKVLFEPVSLRGENTHKLDEKYRVIIPTALRDALGDKAIMTRGWNGCLFLYPQETFLAIEKTLLSKPALNQAAIDLKRWFIGSAEDVSVDGQGRMTIPENLRLYARIFREVISLGTGDKIEIWGKEAWEQHSNSQTETALREAAVETGLGAIS
jgi:MraZ protein